ncbi:MAG TPA: pyridoxamine 5'-phosphate oxidase family protein [Sulfuricurvum sp.]|nr:MAG: hypothetical protein B7Y30_03200 [Campylobacterales bacterium 16-40-21]OZA03913.1 MAG: hypothetical protein B7X89_04385 [Sulfuricurvum sp. 17-40-25]HQS65560.1 pyridoxamine 5'-phosphate oxidase family protein [Sulfuricurvum sp.]HQT37665.1 pyridoxamine 5'-phosphate oxidase family protein [Sulfuricurvum sp.]
MGSQNASLNDQDKAFIAEQKMFFIASSSGEEVNLSPRGYDCFKITGDNEAVFLDYAGSGNRTARDSAAHGEITIMFCSFTDNPMILRLFCKGETIDKKDTELQELFHSSDLKGMRQFIKLTIYCVEHSCGMSVPRYEFINQRNDLKEWCHDEDRAGRLDGYIQRKLIPLDLSTFKPGKNV